MGAATKQLNIELYKKLYLIRKSEDVIAEHYSSNDMKTPMHMTKGGEHIAAGVCHALASDGPIFCTYRSHGVYLSNTMETDSFFGELYGRTTGMAKGKAGSMHLSSIDTGFFGASAIVGSVIPLAIGAAYANKIKGTKKVSAVFFGDGAIDEGNFWESLNMACSMKLPVLLVCEDNGLAVHTHSAARHGYDSIVDVVKTFRCNVLQEDATDVEKIHNVAQQAIMMAKEYCRPSFLHIKYCRYLEHVGVNEDFNAGYRSRDEYEQWSKKDPLLVQRNKLSQLGMSEADIVSLEKAIGGQILHSVNLAKEAPMPKQEELYRDVFA